MIKKKDYELIAEAYDRICLNERVYQLTSAEQEGVKEIVDRYMRFFDPKKLKMPIFKIISIGPEKVYKDYINEKGFIPVGLVKFHDDKSNTDKEIPVYVSFERDTEDKGAYEISKDESGYEEEYIVLYYYKTKYNEDFVEDALVHELFHAKQPYKTPGEHYSRSKYDYYKDPVEVHNYVSNIIKAIENEYLKRDSKGQAELLKFIEEFIRQGRLPELPESALIKNIGKDEFVDFLYGHKDDPKIKPEYRKFINKLNWLYTNLKDYQNR